MECNSCCNKDAIIEELREQVKDHDKRINQLEKDNSVNAYRFEQIMNICSELKTDVNEIKEKPSRWIQVAITSIITVSVGAAITYFGTLLFK